MRPNFGCNLSTSGRNGLNMAAHARSWSSIAHTWFVQVFVRAAQNLVDTGPQFNQHKPDLIETHQHMMDTTSYVCNQPLHNPERSALEHV